VKIKLDTYTLSAVYYTINKKGKTMTTIKSSKPQGRHITEKTNAKILVLLDDLGWEYDRMTSSGQETLDKLYKIFGMMTNEEADWLVSKVQNI
tara:strand:+ start:55 stop:333 length:279 start_codon:yes stop_codon:yes gene_type:complete